MLLYLEAVGGDQWMKGNPGLVKNPTQALIEFAGRLCYKSWIPGLNPNVTKIRTDQSEYLQNIVKSKHGSVLEHAQFTFVFHDVSRIATHEIVRHRAGVAISQESMRYVRIEDVGLMMPDLSEWVPEEVQATLFKDVVTLVEHLEDVVKATGRFLDQQGMPFNAKKQVTSAIRRILPMGTSTEMVWSANLRTLRHVVEARTSLGAEIEMRDIFSQVAEIMMQEVPDIFNDFIKNKDGEWVPEYSKV